MKKIFFILLLPVGLVYGQQSPIFPDFKPGNLPAFGNEIPNRGLYQQWRNPAPLFLEEPTINKLKDWMEANIQGLSMNAVLNGRFSHRTQDGSSVFNIGPDNMPCLVPDMGRLEKMPRIKPYRNYGIEPMPNFSPRIELMPKGAFK